MERSFRLHKASGSTFNLLYLLSILLLTGCDTSEVTRVDSIFSTRDYFINESERLNKNKISLKTITTHNGKETTTLIKAPKWDEVFEPFIQADISKPTLAAYYKKEQSIVNGDTIVSYSSSEEKQSVKRLSIFYNGSVKKISIERSNISLLYNSTSHYLYTPGEGYIITGQQISKNLPGITYKTVGSFFKE